MAGGRRWCLLQQLPGTEGEMFKSVGRLAANPPPRSHVSGREDRAALHQIGAQKHGCRPAPVLAAYIFARYRVSITLVGRHPVPLGKMFLSAKPSGRDKCHAPAAARITPSTTRRGTARNAFDNGRVELRAGATHKLCRRLLVSHRLAVRPRPRHRVVGAGHRHDSG